MGDITNLAQLAQQLAERQLAVGPAYLQALVGQVELGFGDRRQAAQVAQTSTLLVFVAAGTGVAVLPASAARLRLEGVTFVGLEDAPRVELAVGWRPDASPAAQRVVERITAVLGAGSV